MSSLGSFFDAGDCSSSEDEVEEITTPSTGTKSRNQEKELLSNDKEKLPSPMSVLMNTKRPEFLRSADELARRDLISEKRDQLEKDRENQTGVFAPKVPVGEIPPRSVLPSAVVSSKPVHYTQSTATNHVDSSTGSESVSAVKRAASIMGGGGDEVSEPSAKRSVDADSFTQKENRK
eukprot:scpid73501/ scgid18110/ 